MRLETLSTLERGKFIDRDSLWYIRRVEEAVRIRHHPENIGNDNGTAIPAILLSTSPVKLTL